jgi:uncharacterized membrane protein
MNIRNALIAIAVAFGVWEATDIPDTGVPAAVFAVLFFACTVWLWRRGSRISAVILGLLFTVEATQAHTWKDASTTAKDAAMVLGSAGIIAAAGFLVSSVRPLRVAKRSAP